MKSSLWPWLCQEQMRHNARQCFIPWCCQAYGVWHSGQGDAYVSLLCGQEHCFGLGGLCSFKFVI